MGEWDDMLGRGEYAKPDGNKNTRFVVSQEVVPDLRKYPFITVIAGGHIEVNVPGLLNAFLNSEANALEILTGCINSLDRRAAEVEANLPQGAQILPATLDEADRAGYIDGLRAGARHLSLKLGTIFKPDARPEKEDTDDQQPA